MAGYRKERTVKLIRMIIADALIKEVKDPRIGFVTVTDVELNKDGTLATVKISVLGDEKTKKESLIGLNSAKGFLQYQISQEIKMRNIPKIRFVLDSTIEYSGDIIDKLTTLEKQREQRENNEEENEESSDKD